MIRRPIQAFGRVYDYLKDAQLRLEEKQKERIVIENAEFNGEEFINVAWGYCDFVNCHFPASHNIQLTQLANCNFIECEFGPTRDDDSINFGDCREVVFRRCKFNMGNIGCTEGEASFEQCECINPNPDPNHGYVVSGSKVKLIDCSATNYGWRATRKLIVQNCTMNKGSAELLSGGSKYRPDFELIESTFENAEEILWGAELKNLTIIRCVAEGIFSAQNVVVHDTGLLEQLTRGHFDLWGAGFKKKLHVKDCYFNTIDEKTKAYFRCIGGYSKETLIERVSAGGLVNLTTATDKTTEAFRYPKAQNDLFIVRDCKIPHLKINWLQSACLRLENCKIGQLEIRDGRIGRLEIKNTKYESLDISRTIVDDYAIERLASGVIIDTGSNYDSATGKAKKK